MPSNTFFPDHDLVYARVPEDDDDLVEIAFEDMEPIESIEMIGIEPHAAIAILPVADFDCIGEAPFGAIAAPDTTAFPNGMMNDLGPDFVQTEEFASFDDLPTSLAM